MRKQFGSGRELPPNENHLNQIGRVPLRIILKLTTLGNLFLTRRGGESNRTMAKQEGKEGKIQRRGALSRHEPWIKEAVEANPVS